MREVRTLSGYTSELDGHFIRELKPEIFRQGMSPYTDIRRGQRVFLSDYADRDHFQTYWCSPAKSPNNIQNFHGIAIQDLDAMSSMMLLNHFIAGRYNGADEELITKAAERVIADFCDLRPDNILGVEGIVATPETRKVFTEDLDFDFGQPHLLPEKIAYLGTIESKTKDPKAIGINGYVFVKNSEPGYVGPIFVLRSVGRDQYGNKFVGLPMETLTGSLRRRIKKDLRTKQDRLGDDMSRVEQVALEHLE